MACAPRLDWRGRAAVLARSHMNSMITFERTTKTSNMHSPKQIKQFRVRPRQI